MAKHMHISEYEANEATLLLSCSCGWEGKATEANGELHEAIMDIECPKCDKMLLIVNLVVDPKKYYD